MTTSQSEETPTEMVLERLPPMPVDIYTAAIKGDGNILLQRLGLSEEQQNHIPLQVDAPNPTPQPMEMENQMGGFNLQSVTEFGDTVLHLLITNWHSELALKVFQKDASMLKVQNHKLETPLHCLARTGNEKVFPNLIHLNSEVVQDVLAKTNDKGETALHVAARHGNVEIGRQLMKMDPHIAYKVDKEKSSPLYLALSNRCTEMVQTMLEEDVNLACIPDLDGMFPVHVAARTGNVKLVKFFMEKYPSYAELSNSCGKNLLHIAVEENQVDLFLHVDATFKEIMARMIYAIDYDGNTPLHIAATKGYYYVMRAIWEGKMNNDAQKIRNKQGLTPLELSARQLLENSEDIRIETERRIRNYFKVTGRERFTRAWFNNVMRMAPKKNWEEVQVIGLGSVLITTISFAAAFTIPGGYDQNNGIPILVEKYMFKVFILANALAFVAAFVSLFTLLVTVSGIPYGDSIRFASYLFMLASSSMVVAFGSGLYATLASSNMGIAILILVLTLLLGSPVVFFVTVLRNELLFNFIERSSGQTFALIILSSYVLPFLFIFCLAFL